MTAITSDSDITEHIRQDYRSVLIRIARDLDKKQQEEVRFYCTEYIPKRTKGTLKLFLCLENLTKISWLDVSYLRDCMHVIQREDLVKQLAAFEFKRDLTLLLNSYAGKRLGLDSSSDCSGWETNIAGKLVQLMEVARNTVDVEEMLIKSDRDAEKLCIAFAEESGVNGRPLTCRKLAMMAAIAGESIVINSSRHRQPEELMKISSNLASKLGTRMAYNRGWEEFCEFVEKRYQHVYHQQPGLGSNPGLSWRTQVVDLSKQLEEVVFFP